VGVLEYTVHETLSALRTDRRGRRETWVMKRNEWAGLEVDLINPVQCRNISPITYAEIDLFPVDSVYSVGHAMQ
jgi:hypothetical protein